MKNSDVSYTEIRDLIIGFDLGSSSTKVVIRDNSLDKSFAIPFHDYSMQENLYLLPTGLVKIGPDTLRLQAANESPGTKDIKLQILENNKYKVVASIYIGFVLKYSLNYFLRNYADIYKDINIRWHLNLGIPAKNYDDEYLKNIFKGIAIAGCHIYDNDFDFTDKIKLKNILEIVKNHDFNKINELTISKELIKVVPEVIAAAYSYEKSTMRQKGLHILIDVGATTFDVTSFIITGADSEPDFSLPYSKVEKYGSYILHKKRVYALSSIINNNCKNMVKIENPASKIPDSEDAYLKFVSDKFLYSDDIKEFKTEVTNVLCKVLTRTRKKDPNSSSWKNELKVFLCGGGSYLSFYNDFIVHNAESRLKNNGMLSELKTMSLPYPNDLEADLLPDDDYHRLAVAYGLSFPFFELGRIFSESEVDEIDFEKVNSSRYENFISKELV